MRQSLVTTLLKAAGYYIFVDSDRDLNACNGVTGARWINNQCYTIEQGQPFPLNGRIADTTKPIDRNVVLNFDDPKKPYNIDMNTFYTNADACQPAHPNFDGIVDTAAIPTDGSLPTCFFNLPVIKGSTSPCVAVAQSRATYPDSLGFVPESCEPPPSIPPPGGPRPISPI